MTEQVELAVVGAGPAGIQAALAAARAGVSVVLIDGYPRPGGQYFKQLPAAFRADDRSRHGQEAAAVLERLALSNVRLLPDTDVWGAFPAPDGAWELDLCHRDGSRYGPSYPSRIVAPALVPATGAHDRPLAFPGWDLPGVMAAGAAQTLIKSQRVLPGRRVLLSGTGPLQLAVAASLARAGADVVAVLEGLAPGPRALPLLTALWGQWPRLAEGWDYGRVLASAHVRYRFGWSVVEARGRDEVEGAVIARIDPQWRPIPGTEETVAVDTIVIGYGLVPRVELSRLLGCEHAYHPQQGGFVPRRDAEMQTTLPGVYAAGDGAGIGGAELAAIEGEIAGIAVARRLGHLAEGAAGRELARLGGLLARQQRYARMLGLLFTPGPGLDALATDDTTICRCEEVTLGDIRQALADGAQTVEEIKAVTRLGMGNCQGRICAEQAARLFAREAGLGEDYLRSLAGGIFTPRPPIQPVPLAVMASAEVESRE